MEVLLKLPLETWLIVKEASLYMLIGFFIAGFIHVLVPASFIVKFLGRSKIRSVFNAALLGIPLPLCSCGVLPAAMSIRKQGANRGATVSFLIATPESGLPSISMTWGLMDPLMTVARPITAFLSAFVAGIAENFLLKDDSPKVETEHADASHCESCHKEEKKKETILARFKGGMQFAFIDLIDDIAVWLLVGFVLAGVISSIIPGDFIARNLGNTFVSKLIMVMVGVPLYICATASTPIAAALILKGMSPGTALVFLLAGPATNIGSLPILVKFLGKKSVALYLISISVMSIAMGYALDFIYEFFKVKPLALARAHEHSGFFLNTAEWIAAIVLLLLIFLSFAKKIFRKATPQ